MTARFDLPRWSIASAFLAAVTAMAQVAFSALPGGVSIAQAQACNPQIGIDAPAPGDTVSGTATFSGWAVDLATPAGSGVDSVRLYKDAPPEQGGIGLAVATTGISRPDIDAANNLTNSGSGWSADVDFSSIPSGSYKIFIYAHTMCGWTYAEQSVSVSSSESAAAPAPAAPAIQIALDSPTAGAMVNNGQAVTVSGWAVDGAGAGSSGIDSVRVFLDGQADAGGQALGFANYGKTRSDVVNASGNPDWARSGFDLVWPVAGVSPGSHVLYIYAHSTATGQWDYTTVPVTVSSAGVGPGSAGTTSGAASSNAIVKIESPAGGVPLTAPTVIRGYALDCSNGYPAGTVRVYSGTNTSGKLLGSAQIGAGARELTSICSTSGLSGSANVGFTFTVDPSTLPPGAQAITVAADTTSGPVTATLSFGGGNPNANASASSAGASGTCTPSTSSVASPFAVTCPTISTTPNTNANANSQFNSAQTNPNCVPGAVYGNGQFQNQNPQNYAAQCASVNANTAYNTGYNNSQYNPAYNGQSTYNPNPTNYNSTNYNPAYNNANYNSYNQPAYNNYNNAAYPYQNTAYNSQNYYGNQNQYPYNNYNQYTPTSYNYNTNPYSINGSYVNPYAQNYGANYGNYGNPYGYSGVPNGYSTNYAYAGNAGANYGNPYGNQYGTYGGGYPYNGFGNPYGNPYQYGNPYGYQY